MNLTVAGLVLAAYLIGAIPFGLLIGWHRGVDIREHGSRNIGATNVGRVVGRRWGMLCLALDLLKGLIPVAVSARLLLSPDPTTAELTAWLAVGMAAVLGHNFPIYLGFRGGKGVATTIGVALGTYPYFAIPMVASLLIYALARGLTGLVSVGSLCIAVTFPVAFWAFVALREDIAMQRVWPMQLVAVLLGVLMIVRHRSNLARLLRGDELRATNQPAQARG